MQIDFLIQKEVVTSRHNISPIEVKSGTNYTLTSINKCIKKDGLTYLPLYMTPLL